MAERELRCVPASALVNELPTALSGNGPAILPVPDAVNASAHLAHGARVPANVALVIETSGSMSHPKRVMLSASALRASAAATAEFFDTGDGAVSSQWLLALPEHYIAGAQVVVRALEAGTAPVRYSGTRFVADTLCNDAERMHATERFVSLVPAQLATLLAGPDTARVDATMRRFTAVLVGGQAIPQRMRAEAAARNWPVCATYGSSETAGGIAYNAQPLPDVRVREVDGELHIAAPSLAEGYLDDAARTRDRFITDAGTRWYRTGDAGLVHPGGRIRVLGRLDNVIISGGVKINLDEVERALLDALGAEVVAVGISDARWGERVAVAVRTPGAPAASLDDAPASIPPDQALAALSPFGAAGRPAVWLQALELPRLDSGKPDRRRIREIAQRAGDECAEHASGHPPA